MLLSNLKFFKESFLLLLKLSMTNDELSCYLIIGALKTILILFIFFLFNFLLQLVTYNFFYIRQQGFSIIYDSSYKILTYEYKPYKVQKF